MAAKLSKSNLSLEKALKIIETLADSLGPMRLSRIANDVDMPASTVLRMLNTLVECGYVYQEDEEQKRYGLTMRIVQLGQKVMERFSIRDVARPYLEQLVQQSKESCCLAVEENNNARYVDVIEGTHNLITIRQRVGGSAPMHCTGSGKLILSQYSKQTLKDFFENNQLPRLTPHTIATYEEMEFELEKIGKNGYAIDDEECEIGVRCIAAPIYDYQQKIVAVVSLSGPISRMTNLRMEKELIPLVCECARQISAKL